MELFETGDRVKIVGTSKGRGFPGGRKAVRLCRPTGIPRPPNVADPRIDGAGDGPVSCD